MEKFQSFSRNFAPWACRSEYVNNQPEGDYHCLHAERSRPTNSTNLFQIISGYRDNKTSSHRTGPNCRNSLKTSDSPLRIA
ncbi:unnamed protein product, partial [Nesidiocoris tenuis]